MRFFFAALEAIFPIVGVQSSGRKYVGLSGVCSRQPAPKLSKNPPPMSTGDGALAFMYCTGTACMAESAAMSLTFLFRLWLPCVAFSWRWPTQW